MVLKQMTHTDDIFCVTIYTLFVWCCLLLFYF